MAYFKTHIVEAIEVNSSRRSYYTQIAGWRAYFLSRCLVLSERICIPLAYHFDKRAQPYIDCGVNIVKDDFVSMELINEPSTPTRYNSIASRQDFKAMKVLLKETRLSCIEALKKQNYQKISKLVANCLYEIERREKALGCHFAMTKHIAESAGIAALHSLDYIRQDPEAEDLCLSLTKVQVNLLENSLWMDKLAQKCHQKGAAIIVNDVPHIPFLSEYEAQKHALTAEIVNATHQSTTQAA